MPILFLSLSTARERGNRKYRHSLFSNETFKECLEIGHSLGMKKRFQIRARFKLDDYKEVRMVNFQNYKKSCIEVEVYSLSTNSWKRIREIPHLIKTMWWHSGSAFHNGVVYRIKAKKFDFCPAAFLVQSGSASVKANKFNRRKEKDCLICNLDVDREKLLVCKPDLDCIKTLHFGTEVNRGLGKCYSWPQDDGDRLSVCSLGAVKWMEPIFSFS
ncbi:DNA-directed primase/polymerase protein-like [Pyrus ussuriensis x Pyrus communis]|uniref:DNA-directed primase/polymerase protein-like n=1 Tax=Pyrus ussuriensis x Pyrus communis TaxID=2448454 RepID=A0A5N5FMU1_9ROSA|nr:DNA-directed primase/polymerase protein-like [Pyrus ussuriensis x Pyrus communis]KAB2604478.1 DNA-directed primase/polymerase protein-like [Pyrus ussuriensis x Pyrus communis]